MNIPDANFKNALVNDNVQDTDGNGSYDNDVDTNDDGEIQVSEAEAVQILKIDGKSISSISGIENFANLKSLDCSNNILTTIDMTFLTEIDKFDCSNNDLINLNWSNLIRVNNSINFSYNSLLTNVDLSSLISVGGGFTCTSNGGLQSLYLNSLKSVGGFFEYRYNNSLQIIDLSNLETVNSMSISYDSVLTTIKLNSLHTVDELLRIGDTSQLINVDLLNLVTVGGFLFIRNDNSAMTSLDIRNLQTVVDYDLNSSFSGGHFTIQSNDFLTDINIDGLQTVEASFECLGTPEGFSVLSAPNLTSVGYGIEINCNNLVHTDLSSLVTVTYDIDYSSYSGGNLDLRSLETVSDINAGSSELNTIDLRSLSAASDIDLSDNNLSVLDLNELISAYNLEIKTNSLTSLLLDNLSNVTSVFDVSGNHQLTTLNLPILTNVGTIKFGGGALVDFNFENATVGSLHCYYLNQLTSLDLSTINITGYISIINNSSLESLFIKNGSTNSGNFNIGGNPNLKYICVDLEELSLVESKVLAAGYTNCEVNSYCSFVPGGEYYTIEGIVVLDSDNNGCTVTDINYPNLKFDITNDVVLGSLIANDSGDFYIPVHEGTHTVTPQFENPTYWSVSPLSITVDFPTDTSPYNQDFCITPNGVHNDLEITILPVTGARPGFDSDYKLVYKNKGNTTLSGSVNFTFNDDLMDLVSASPMADVQSTGSLNWNYTNLQPFETGSIEFCYEYQYTNGSYISCSW